MGSVSIEIASDWESIFLCGGNRDIKLVVIDVAMFGDTCTTQDAMALLRQLRTDGVVAPAIVICPNAKHLREIPDHTLFKREGHQLLEIPFSFQQLKEAIKQANPLSAGALAQIQKEDCHPLGIITQPARRLLEVLQEMDTSDGDARVVAGRMCQKEYDDLLWLLNKYLPEYFGEKWKQSVRAGLERMTDGTFTEDTRSDMQHQIQALIDSMPVACGVEMFCENRHGVRDHPRWRSELEIWQNIIEHALNKTLKIEWLVANSDKSRWWETLSGRVHLIQSGLKQIHRVVPKAVETLIDQLDEIEGERQSFMKFIGELRQVETNTRPRKVWNAKLKKAREVMNRADSSYCSVMKLREQLLNDLLVRNREE